MPTSDDISASIRAQLKILDPDLSLEPLTPERKIVDTVAETIADASSDQFVLQYQFDVDTKTGTDLDKFVAIFGFARQGGTRATGIVTFSVDQPATSDVFIPIGTQVMTGTTVLSNPITFVTTSSVVIYTGTTSVDAPIECLNVGVLGNVPASTITVFNNVNIGATTSVGNAVATTNGSDFETDAELRVRFKNTIFRNIAGTKSQYLALAVYSQFANKANVIGSMDRFTEYIQVDPNGNATSVIPYSQYAYNVEYYLTNPNGSGGEIFFNSTSDYSFNSTNPGPVPLTGTAPTTNTIAPQITLLQQDSSRGLVDGGVLLLEHSYCSVNSRNNPNSNIYNYVDVYVNGDDEQDATDALVFPSNQIFTTTTGSSYFVGKFRRFSTRVLPQTGNVFQQLIFQPAITLPSSLTVNGTVLTLNNDYFLVEDTTVTKGSRRARNGIEWATTAQGAIGIGTAFTVSYTYNKLIITLNALMEEHKSVTSDVLVHAATNRYFNVNLVTIYSPGFIKSSVDSAIASALTDYFNKLDFGAIVQFSDIIEISHEVNGVDNVRIAKPTDGVAYGIQEIAPDGQSLVGVPFVTDFFLQDSDLPVLNSLISTQRSQNLFTT